MRNGHGRRRATFLRNLSAQGERVADRVQALGHAAFTRAERAVNRLGDKSKRAMLAAKRAKKRVRTYVTGNPITSVLIAIGIGAVVGYIFHRRPKVD